jgi:DNA-binding NtrC family response regulator
MSPPTIVCVDDDAQIARTLARAFKKEQLHPLSTTEPEEALEFVAENDVAVLVTDYEMANMNGIELACRVREMSPTTVRILITGHLQIDTVMASINQGEVFRFVPKPFSIDSLLAIVREAIELHRGQVAAATAREQAALRAKINAELEALHPTLTTPARAHDGAYLVQRRADAQFADLGLDPLLALRHK